MCIYRYFTFKYHTHICSFKTLFLQLYKENIRILKLSPTTCLGYNHTVIRIVSIYSQRANPQKSFFTMSPRSTYSAILAGKTIPTNKHKLPNKHLISNVLFRINVKSFHCSALSARILRGVFLIKLVLCL